MKLFTQLTLVLVMLLATQNAIAQPDDEPCTLLLENGLYKTFKFAQTANFEQDLKTYFSSDTFKEDMRNRRWGGDINVVVPIDGVPTKMGLGANANNDEITKFQQNIAGATSLKVSQSFFESSLTSIPDIALAAEYSNCLHGQFGLKPSIDVGDSEVTFSISYRKQFNNDPMPTVKNFAVIGGVVLSGAAGVGTMLGDNTTIVVRRLPGKDMVFVLDTDRGSIPRRIPGVAAGVLQETSLHLPLDGSLSSCADPSNTDRQGFTNPSCTWLDMPLVPKGDSSEFQVSLELTISMTNTSLDGGGCSDPHRQAEVFLKYGNQGESHSGMLGKTNVNEATQQYSLTALFKTSRRPVPLKVFINPRGCTKVTLNSGELNFKEVKQ